MRPSGVSIFEGGRWVPSPPPGGTCTRFVGSYSAFGTPLRLSHPILALAWCGAGLNYYWLHGYGGGLFLPFGDT